MTLVTIPRIILGSFSVIVVDRSDRKKLIIIGDVVRGPGILFVYRSQCILKSIYPYLIVLFRCIWIPVCIYRPENTEHNPCCLRDYRSYL